jgi:tetratricopeptide (TPR) repeat protein
MFVFSRRLLGTVVVSGIAIVGTLSAGEDAPPKPAPATPPAATPATPAAPPKVAAPAPAPAPIVPKPIAAPKPPIPEMTPAVKDMTDPRYLLDLAQVHLRYNALERAEEMLKKAQPLAKEPDVKMQIGFALGTLLQRKQDYKGAAASIEEVINQASNISMRAQYTLILADVYAQDGAPERAEKALNDLAATVGPNPKPEEQWIRSAVTNRLSSIWQSQPGKIEQMITASEEALAKDPNNADALTRLGELYNSSARRDPVKTASVYEKLLALKPNDVSLMLRLASAYQENRQYDKAIDMHQKILKVDAKGVGQSSNYQIAQLLLQSGKKDEAVKWAKEHMANDANSPYNAMMMASFLEHAGLSAEAEEAYAKLRDTAQAPQKAEYTLRLAEFARRRKDYKKAEDELQAALKENPDDKNINARANAALMRIKQEQATPKPPVPVAPVAPVAPPPAPKAPDAPKPEAPKTEEPKK